MNRRAALKLTAASAGALVVTRNFLNAEDVLKPFGDKFARLESLTTGDWWKRPSNMGVPLKGGRNAAMPNLNVPRDQVVAFAIYTHQNGVLKITGQLFPLTVSYTHLTLPTSDLV